MDAPHHDFERIIGALETKAHPPFDHMVTAEGPPGGPIVAFIAGEPGLADRLLVQHTDDGTGHCRVCTSGAQTGRSVWPCPLRGLAEQANNHTTGGPR
jgi:hypothetical protein